MLRLDAQRLLRGAERSGIGNLCNIDRAGHVAPGRFREQDKQGVAGLRRSQVAAVEFDGVLRAQHAGRERLRQQALPMDLPERAVSGLMDLWIGILANRRASLVEVGAVLADRTEISLGQEARGKRK